MVEIANGLIPGLLLGTYTPRLDDKARLILPTKFRGALERGLVMTRGQERCLYILPIDEFKNMYTQIKNAPLGDKLSRDYLRIFLSGAVDEMPDKQGRVTIPQILRSYANLDRDVVVIGAGTRLEVWDKQAWDDYLQNNIDAYSHTSEEVLPR
ncbi:MAG: division/cell wall cluster transcriptional repressor MraZ [Candidatus Ancillula sp.]|jgi:MraZ protein|nr:division/cell wall cluster transcriptional repressor MraZ [Candidatus Ancillula sp.]